MSSLEGVQAGLESKLLAHDGENLGEVKDGSDSKMHVSNGYIGCSENKYYLPFSAAYAIHVERSGSEDLGSSYLRV